MADADTQNTHVEDRTGTTLEDMLAVTRELTVLVREEIALLEARKPGEISRLQSEKQRLSALYSQYFEALKTAPCAANGSDDALRQSLRTATETFQAEVERLGRMIARFRVVTEGIVRAITEEAQRQKAETTGYSGGGARTGGPQTKPVSLALNQTV